METFKAEEQTPVR